MESPQKRAIGSVPAKFVLKKKEAVQEPSQKKIYEEGLALLKKEQDKITAKSIKAKIKASEELSKDPKNKRKQDILAEAIKATHITTEDFSKELDKIFVIKDNIISYKEIPIANLLDSHSSQAYTETKPAIGVGYSPIYKRASLDESGYSATEYVSVNGNMLRRIAYRGVTPSEIDLYLGKKPLTPYFHGNLTKETGGIHFDDDGTYFERSKKKSDVNFLKSLGSIQEKQFPASDRELLAFTQIRQGASKVLSGTSTNHEIKSNHGAGFGKFGVVTIDLAQVPTNNILRHYNVEAFDTGRVKAMIQKLNEQSIRAKYNARNPAPDGNTISIQATSTIQDEEIDKHVVRGNLSSIRNREILFTAIPYEAITNFKLSPERSAYVDQFTATFKDEVLRLFNTPYYNKVIGTKDRLGNPEIIIKKYLNLNKYAVTKEVGVTKGLDAAKHHMDTLVKDIEEENSKKGDAEIASKPASVRSSTAPPVRSSTALPVRSSTVPPTSKK